ncbi:MAG: hypothetical protein HOE45_10490 [Gammaproteobacteria bacterium]|jgi:hypothetical protein|nr:hypothetical protein [Gammaproteobacteria bacterium]
MKANYKRMHFKSGFNVSIQANETNYCEPRNNIGPYTSVELGFPSAPEPLIIGYAEDADNPTETVYGWVPAGVVQALISKHGGIEDGTLPEFNIDAEQAAILAEALLEVENASR